MKMLSVLLALAIGQPLSPGDLDRVRSDYMLAMGDSKRYAKMIAWLETRKEDPLCLDYLGGFRAINARHLSGPLRKLQSFRRGTAEIDQAVLLRPKDVEIRFIRHSIQLGAPGDTWLSGQH
ncbi:hypothetical protein [uncultured Flavobacterium sp.]|uniref:hypothetical protein n=1 Tax=uncultured Flavobacterium sp. TaxID=165435 RepID=UPI0025E203BF|nr:hypothetical protein [uncultured Flavobacterium sp.]